LVYTNFSRFLVLWSEVGLGQSWRTLSLKNLSLCIKWEQANSLSWGRHYCTLQGFSMQTQPWEMTWVRSGQSLVLLAYPKRVFSDA
jgi:hypothetical protein